MEAGIVPHRPHVTIAVLQSYIVALQLDCELLTVDLRSSCMIESQQSNGCACMHLAIYSNKHYYNYVHVTLSSCYMLKCMLLQEMWINKLKQFIIKKTFTQKS